MYSNYSIINLFIILYVCMYSYMYAYMYMHVGPYIICMYIYMGVCTYSQFHPAQALWLEFNTVAISSRGGIWAKKSLLSSILLVL